MSVQQIDVPALPDESLELAISRVERDLVALMGDVETAAGLPGRLVGQVGSAAHMDPDSAVRADARFLIDANHFIRSCGVTVHENLEILTSQRQALSKTMDLGPDKHHIARASSARQLGKIGADAAEFAQMVEQRLAAAGGELVTEEGRQMSEHLQIIKGHLGDLGRDIDTYARALQPRPKLESVDMAPDLGGFSERAQSHSHDDRDL